MTICKTRTGSRGNLILSLNEANETIKTYPVPAVGYIGFIGACQPKAFAPDFEPCANPCTLDQIAASIEETLRGYVLALNWLVQTIASTVTFTVWDCSC